MVRYIIIERIKDTLSFDKNFELIDLATIDNITEHEVQISLDGNYENIESIKSVINFIKEILTDCNELNSKIKIIEAESISRYFFDFEEGTTIYEEDNWVN